MIITEGALTNGKVLSRDKELQKMLNGKILAWAIIQEQWALNPIRGGDGRVLVQVDEYTSKRDCSKCKGKGHLGQPCEECKGNGRFRGKPEHEDRCTTCYVIKDRVQGAAGAIDLYGKQPCDLCKGTGSSSIVVPDDSKNKTTTGDVIAISAVGILEVKVGDKVMFTNYTGSPFQFVDIDFRIITEKDLLCKVKKLRENAEGIKEGTFADLENTGVAHE